MKKETQHPNLSVSFDLNQKTQTLYKYRFITKKFHKDVLFEQTIYFPSIDELNDPFDSRISFNFSELDSSEIKFYIDNIRSKISTEQELQNLKIFEQFLNQNDNKAHEMLRDFEIDAINKFAGIFSTSLNWDNILMWSHYAENHSGFIIGFDEKKMRNSLLFHFGANVEYPENLIFPKIKPSMNENELFYKRFFVKSKDWSYENEFRIINDFRELNEKRTVKFPIELISEVIIGFKMNDIDKDEITKFCKENKIRLFQTIPEKHKFSLTRIQI